MKPDKTFSLAYKFYINLQPSRMIKNRGQQATMNNDYLDLLVDHSGIHYKTEPDHQQSLATATTSMTMQLHPQFTYGQSYPILINGHDSPSHLHTFY